MSYANLVAAIGLSIVPWPHWDWEFPYARWLVKIIFLKISAVRRADQLGSNENPYGHFAKSKGSNNGMIEEANRYQIQYRIAAIF
jgi:hypothetical protein